MQVFKPNETPLTPAEQQNLDKIKRLIEIAVADGKISRQDIEAIGCQIHANGTVSCAELQLYHTLVSDKLRSGELEMDY